MPEHVGAVEQIVTPSGAVLTVEHLALFDAEALCSR